ncbi:MAG: hypothetical protein ACRD59_12585 [Candidatus Acidiferrales bacterium]
MRGPLSPSTAMRGPAVGARALPVPPHIPRFPVRRFQPIFFFGGGCFNGFFPGFCGSGFFPGLGFWGYGWGCDLYWGCLSGYNNGYYNGGGAYGNLMYDDSSGAWTPSQESNPSRYAYPSAGAAGESDTSATSPDVVLFLKDGTVYALTDYWVAGGKLHYMTNYGGENSIDLEQIDMQRTVDVNHKRGIDITLKPAPALTPNEQDQEQAPPDAPE